MIKTWTKAIPYRLLAYLQVGRLRTDVCRVHDRAQVDPGPLVEEAPNLARHEREDALEDEYQRDPLVVADPALLPVGLLGVTTTAVDGVHHRRVVVYRRQQVLLAVEPIAGDDLGHRQIERVRDPADRVGIVNVARRELGRTPAVDRVPDELLGADEESETDGDDDRELTTQAIHVVVVHVELELSDTQDGLEESFHLVVSG